MARLSIQSLIFMLFFILLFILPTHIQTPAFGQSQPQEKSRASDCRVGFFEKLTQNVERSATHTRAALKKAYRLIAYKKTKLGEYGQKRLFDFRYPSVELVHYLRMHPLSIFPERREIIILVEQQATSNSMELNPFSRDPEDIRRLYGEGKDIDNITLLDAKNFFENQRAKIQRGFSETTIDHERRSFTFFRRLAVYSSFIAIGAFGFNWLQSKSAGYSAAPSELGGTESRRSSYSTLFGSMPIPEDSKRIYEIFLRAEDKYFRQYNSVITLMQQHSRDALSYPPYMIFSALNIYYNNEQTFKDTELKDSLIRFIYFMRYAHADYFYSEGAEMIKIRELTDKVLNEADPDKAILNEMIEDLSR